MKTHTNRPNGLTGLTGLTIALLLGLLVLNTPGTASAGDRERIDGVAKFLLDRANDNSLYVFEMKLKSNQALKLYLPTVYSYLESYDLYMLLQSSPEMWERAVQEDLDALMDRYKEILKTSLENKVMEGGISLMKLYDGVVGDIRFTAEGASCTLANFQDNDPVCTAMHAHISEAYGTELNGLASAFEQELAGMGFGGTDIIDEMTRLKSTLIKTNDEVVKILNNPEFSITNRKEVLRRTGKLLKDVEALEKISGLIREYQEYSASNKPSITVRVDIALQVMELMYDYYEEKLFTSGEDRKAHEKYFERYRAYAFMFAQLADADDADKVQALLASYTLPPVSFGVKREEGPHLTVSSYLGVSGGIESRGSFSGNNDEYAGLVAPIGLEFGSGSKKSGSFGLFLSVIDFGAAVSAQLYDSEHDLEFEDLLAPGVFVVYGLRGLPLAVGFGYQNTRALTDGGRTAHHISAFLAFDMPLFTIY